MSTRLFIFVLWVSSTLLLGGCYDYVDEEGNFSLTPVQFRQPQIGIYPASFNDVGKGRMPPVREYFGPGEIPVLVIRGCGGQTVTVEVTNLATGETFRTDPGYMPQEENTAGFTRGFNLPTGSYCAHLRVSGVIRSSCNFIVKSK